MLSVSKVPYILMNCLQPHIVFTSHGVQQVVVDIVVVIVVELLQTPEDDPQKR